MRKMYLSAICIAIVFLFSSCYTVALKTAQGEGVPDPMSVEPGKFENIQKIEIDTVIKMSAFDKDFVYVVKDCDSGGIFLLEYKNTFSGVLLAAITFGRKRKVKLTYSCNLDQN
ncbi:MAG: hypothetical protein AAFY48_06870 [Bacteroidota bacterium]